MENRNTHALGQKFLVALFSDPNFFSLNILENLLSKNCYVNIITDNPRKWNFITSRISGNGRFSIISPQSFIGQRPEYSIIVAGFLKKDPYEQVEQTLSKHGLKTSKTLIIIPFEKFSYEQNSRLHPDDNRGIVYLGDLFGPRIDLDSDLLVTHLIKNSFYKKDISLGIGESLYPIFVPDAARTITKWIFSFGPYGKETLLLGQQTSVSQFWKVSQSLIGKTNISYDDKLSVRHIPKGLETKTLECNFKFVLSETYRWVSQLSLQIKRPSFLPAFIYRTPKKRNYPKFLKPTVFTTLAVLLLPVVLLVTNMILFFTSYRQFISGNDESAKNIMLITKTLSVVSKEESKALSLIPVLGRAYKEVAFASVVGERVSDIGISGVPVLREVSVLADKIFGNQIYDPSGSSQVLKSGLADLYMQVSLLQADTEEGKSKGLLTARTLERKVNLEKVRNLLLQGSVLAENFSSLTGKEKSKTYLLLFQNNMELRPTGGFIGSFGILTFDGGRIADLTVNDVYSADGQLNGHVEPPAPIKQYLGEANWWLRDSNWDPDFPTSARRAEWFLDKEIGRQVDGVIAIDLEPIKEILKYTGPVFLADYNLNITNENLYEKTQAEVEEDFFPGTHKKASFLTALSRNLLAEISKLDTRQKVGILKTFYVTLEKRHLQLFLHEESSQTAIKNIGWDGAVSMPSCGDGCYTDLTGIVEANVGVNKANYFIKREQVLSVNIAPEKIQRKLTVTLKNESNPQLGLSGKYKVYLRLLTPVDSNIVVVKSRTGEVGEEVKPEISDYKDRKETGVLVEVLGSQTKKIEFFWETQLPAGSQYNLYGLYVRRQAGVGDDPFSLTVNGKSIYNANLEGDYFNRFSF